MGLETTFRLLAKTKNDAASGVLMAALSASDSTLQEAALGALLDRRSLPGQREIVKRLHTINDRWRQIINDHQGRMTHALRDAVLAGNTQLCINGCQAILWFREYDLMPALVNAAEDEANANRDLVAATLLKLAESLYEELATSGDTAYRRDPQRVRHQVIGSLEQSVRRYVRHRRQEVLEAFLLLVNRDNVTFKQILMDPLDSSYLPIMEILSKSQRGGIVRLVLSCLDDPHPPSSAVSLVAHRSDPKFIECLLRKIGYEPTAVAAANLRRVESIGWLQADPAMLDRLDDAAQHAAVQLALRSGMNRLAVFKMLDYLLAHGKPGGRRAASAALGQINGAEANAAALRALDDADPQVRANVLGQLRPRGIPGALSRLIDAIDSPHQVVVDAARTSLAEFNFKRYAATFDSLDEQVRRSTGAIVRKVDLATPKLLAQEMTLTSRTRRLRALAMAEAMDLVPVLEHDIVDLLADEDHLVRAEAARALGQCDSDLARQALRETLQDRSVIVQETAERSLLRLTRAAPASRPAAPTAAIPSQEPRYERLF